MPGLPSITQVTAVTHELVDAWSRLLPQLSHSAPPLTAEALEAIVASDSSVMFVAWLDEQIVGSLTLAMYRIPVGSKAWIEDVVVDEVARGQGIGELLSRAAIAHAQAAGARSIDLTSSPLREAANRLYQRLGFEKRETNVYRWAPPP